MRRILTSTLAVFALTGTAVAQDADGDGPKKPDMHELYRSSSLPKSHADFSRFTYRPPGDKVIEQPDAFRLLFRTRDGQPDGYAERRGNAVIYYDRYGKVTHVQPLPEDDTASN
ncbi:hypothetical protein BAR24_01615 [Gluconobacter oxydans]|uniref:Uncharacterized protein n=1 Tax=Gluconobacter thailandicus TaxID=257438 RepID=A0AAP9EQ50_GLUTH|nr:hypothetical protein [Gluconobacter thailandicus]AFW01088.1 hypothetical protein B932_1509 [Gluconobacter oxydans H24]ANQ40271.1 hypothetical protein BAR24_01615 [Gluconobacter oxydans]GAN91429.1 hypothetical protein Gbfr_037_024 [Gluconobacter frateurii M-2]KXV32882.1 hypothetical protein AD940_13025 [Gluconobacter thailandicus]QEH95468.1 hypothetical protein FXF46_03750 [Gluconobacter thailandicus]